MDDAPQAPVVLLGETMMVFNSPPAVPIRLETKLTATFAGAESNVAMALARLGHPVRMLSAFGDDAMGRSILRSLRGEGVDVSWARVDPNHPTGVMLKSHRPGAEPEVYYYRRGSAFSCCGVESFPQESWNDARVVVTGGITPALSPSCRELTEMFLKTSHAWRIPVSFDLNYRRKLWTPQEARGVLLPWIPLVEILFLNVLEAEMLVGHSSPEAIAESLFSSGASNVVLKAGGDGAYAFSRGTGWHAPPLPIAPVDPIGAGDAFAAGYLSAYLDGESTEQCLRRGHGVGAMCCLSEGDWEGLPDRRELAHFLSGAKEAGR